MINQQFRANFPFFERSPEWVYLDSAATTLKPKVLIEATNDFYCSAGSVHRSQYDFAQTQAYEKARDLVAKRFNVASRENVVWTSGTTHAINLVANGIEHLLQEDDEIVITVAEHHANFIPWQQLAERRQAKLIVLPLDENGQIDPALLRDRLSDRTKIVAFHLISNVTGVRQPAEALVKLIRQYSPAMVLIDMAQAVCCEAVDVQQIGADFYAFSAHKMYGPTGVGALIGNEAKLAEIRPLVYGGKMLKSVSERHLELAELPYRLEAGTPNIAGIIGFGKVLEWLNGWDFVALNQSLKTLLDYAYKRLDFLENVRILGRKAYLTSTISFVVDGIHHADIAAIMAERQIALRSGEHCAKPYLRYLSQAGTLRISLAHYNQQQDIDTFIEALIFAIDLLKE
ncbi:cysteine desulfurase [Haemophilus paracuniculus]|uniref:Probable cysteine desulfurase n=1 Tax=Haemophilus paracuniculus TaxID=734 RepID=A0A1T0ARJ3_9PAST|nr:cysteine desulfurase [Haemophilus paracuniculus]OOR98789.1 cysteine desulfurase [Haemophilus paracuniculus]